jgi:HAD superfamily hydrolase (TIGR01450 family)
MDSVPEITIERVIDRYEVLLFDAYGVLVSSGGALPGATEVIRRLNRTEKPYYIITNDASKLPATAAKRFQEYGVGLSADRIITSGSLLDGYFKSHGLSGKRCAVLGTEDSICYVSDAGGRIVAPGRQFDVLVIADELGFPFVETVDAVFTSLCRAVDGGRNVHLVLPNPDLIYPKADGAFGFCAGSIATMFETALQRRYPDRTDLRFDRLGKPETALFEEAHSRSGTRNMVMIGDQLETDIQGARAFGLDAVWIETGVALGAVAGAPSHLQPTYRMRSLTAN